MPLLCVCVYVCVAGQRLRVGKVWLGIVGWGAGGIGLVFNVGACTGTHLAGVPSGKALKWPGRALTGK